MATASKPATNASSPTKDLGTNALGLGGNSGEGLLTKKGQTAAGKPLSGFGAAAGAQGFGGSASSKGHSVIVTLSVELLAVGLFTLVAGISNDAGRLMVIFMVGLWLIYALTTSQVITHLGALLQGVATQSP
jgi:hypothetical protein